MLDNCGMNSQNYNDLLVDWAAQAPNIQTNVIFGATNNYYYNSAVAARAILTDAPYNWTITDGGVTEHYILDTAFGDNGKVITDVNTTDYGRSVKIDQNNKILLGGMTLDGSNNFMIARYNDDGTLDTAFGTNGIVITFISSSTYNPYNSLAIDASNNVIICCQAQTGGSYNMVLARYNDSGVLDSSFGTGGIVITDFGGLDAGVSVAIDQNNQIVCGGYSQTTKVYYCVAKYLANGTLDSTFGTSGKVTTDISTNSTDDNPWALIIDASNKILLVGNSQFPSTGYDFAMVRYNQNGSLDISFGQNGIVTTDIRNNSDDTAYCVAIDSSNNIVLGGQAIPYYTDFALVRYNQSGQIDTTFGVNGIVTTDIFGNDSAYSIAIDNSNHIVIGGYTDANGFDFIIVKYNADGSRFKGFGDNGSITSDIGTYDQGNSLVIDSQNRILLGGSTETAGNSDFALIRYSYV